MELANHPPVGWVGEVLTGMTLPREGPPAGEPSGSAEGAFDVLRGAQGRSVAERDDVGLERGQPFE